MFDTIRAVMPMSLWTLQSCGWPEPLCLIQNFQGHEMAVDPSTFDKLCQIEEKLVPVSVVGLYRTGKSYLLNQLAGRKSGLFTQIFVCIDFCQRVVIFVSITKP